MNVDWEAAATALTGFLKTAFKAIKTAIASFLVWETAQMTIRNRELSEQNEILKKQADIADDPLPSITAVRDSMRAGDL